MILGRGMPDKNLACNYVLKQGDVRSVSVQDTVISSGGASSVLYLPLQAQRIVTALSVFVLEIYSCIRARTFEDSAELSILAFN